MSVRAVSTKALWGVVPVKPLKHFPEGRARIRMRNTEFVQVFVKTATSIRKFYVDEQEGCFVPTFEIGNNTRAEVTA